MMKASTQISREIEGNETEILLQFFADRILVLVTQMCKVGCLVHFNPTVIFRPDCLTAPIKDSSLFAFNSISPSITSSGPIQA